ncbi:hypothetical protein [Endozoicomonas sp. 8E]|uniref:hypothetical protein n=1 Tax=Endozoicomonas sp. 8E TaxID=3035692 RepID=UPI002938F117|nr:hypothetical protein [Endozoicomonas sp. 8E]WOG29366.1 hypothetical protein P6910_06865 [Endozoicomonas sp. 8E]
MSQNSHQRGNGLTPVIPGFIPVIPDFIPVIPGFTPVIPAKAGIHTDSPPELYCPVPPWPCDPPELGNDDLRAWERAVGVLRHPRSMGTRGLDGYQGLAALVFLIMRSENIRAKTSFPIFALMFIVITCIASSSVAEETREHRLLLMNSSELAVREEPLNIYKGSVSFYNNSHILLTVDNATDSRSSFLVDFNNLNVVQKWSDVLAPSPPVQDSLFAEPLARYQGQKVGPVVTVPRSNLTYIAALNEIQESDNGITITSSLIKVDKQWQENQWQNVTLASSSDIPALKDIVGMTLSADGHLLAIVAAETQTLLIFRYDQGQLHLLQSVSNPEDLEKVDSWFGVHDVTIAELPNDFISAFIASTDRFVHLVVLNKEDQWETQEAQLIGFQNMPQALSSIASSPDGRKVAVIGRRGTIHTLRLVSPPLFADWQDPPEYDYDESDMENNQFVVGPMNVKDPNQSDNRDYSQLIVRVDCEGHEGNCPFIWQNKSLVVNPESDTPLSKKSGGWALSERWPLTVTATNPHNQFSQIRTVVSVKPADYTSRLLKRVFAGLLPSLGVAGLGGYGLIKCYRSRMRTHELNQEDPSDDNTENTSDRPESNDQPAPPAGLMVHFDPESNGVTQMLVHPAPGNTGSSLSLALSWPAPEVIDMTTADAHEVIDTATADAPEVINTTTEDAPEVINTTTEDAPEVINTTTEDAPEVINTTTEDAPEVINTTTADASEATNTSTADGPEATNTTTADDPEATNTTTADASENHACGYGEPTIPHHALRIPKGPGNAYLNQRGLQIYFKYFGVDIKNNKTEEH